MTILFYSYLPEHIPLPNLYQVHHGFYEILIPQFGVFGYGYRINWFNKRLIGIALTNRTIPDFIAEQPQPSKYEQLRLFDES